MKSTVVKTNGQTHAIAKCPRCKKVALVLVNDINVFARACECGRTLNACNLSSVFGKLSTKHVCDVRCTTATGNDCECSCGGKNHGKDHMFVA